MECGVPCESEIENLDRVVLPHHDVQGFEVAVNHADRVIARGRVRDLNGDLQDRLGIPSH
jgi:hypothetical protein